ncbi:Zinc finger BED domain containing protein 1 [Dissostichus eleginoides]|uniref:Zinc finger BED domain containing protein 1 n=1 Tax=Dissostichus eleginoides TaxID=100907 RepID=A0AAD9ERB4_DISEL|nr:Zinc finger BED domain containing protein 1 [Dissostichus eleginoides]
MQTATVSDLAESLSPAEEATAQREDSSGAEESEPAPKRQREKQQDISMLMAFDEDQETEDHKKEMKTNLEDRTKVDKGPLIWWKLNEERYPKLARAAKRIHSIPSTSTPSERIFSKAGFIVSKTRSSLLPDNTDKLVFLSHNMRRLRSEGNPESQISSYSL